MKKLLFLFFLLLIPIHLLLIPQSHKRKREGSQTTTEMSNNVEKLVDALKNEINNADLVKINKLLSIDIASKLSNKQIETLWREANRKMKKTRTAKSERIANCFHALTFLEKFKFPRALFTPIPYLHQYSGPSLDKILIALIMNERVNISVCCFNFTLYNVAYYLRQQKENKNVTVEVVINQKYQTPLQAIKHLVENNIPVYAPKTRPNEINHHKFIIFRRNLLNKSLVWAGSYNLTGNANKNSWEDVIISDDREVVEAYLKRFEKIKASSKPVTREELEKTRNIVSGDSLSRNNVPPGLQRRRPLSE